MNKDKELVALEKQLKKAKAKSGMPMKKKMIYGGAVGAAAVGAALAIGLSVGKDDYKEDVVFDLTNRYSAKQLEGGKTKELIDFNMDNKIIAGDKIIDSTNFIDWAKSERLVKIDKDEVKSAFDGNPNIATYYFAKTKAIVAKPAGASPSLDDAFDDYDAPEEVGNTDPETGEVTTPDLNPNHPKYKGVVPSDYDSAGRRYGVSVVENKGVEDFEQDGSVLHKVVFDSQTGKVMSISDGNGNKIDQTKVDALKPLGSEGEIGLMDEKGDIHKRIVSYSEASAKMQDVITQLGKIRGVTSTRADFKTMTGSDLDVYATNIAGILDMPSYIKLLVDKETGNILHYKLSFDQSLFPGLTEEFAFDHEIVLYQQPGGAMKVMDDAMKWFNAKIATKTWNGKLDKSSLMATSGYDPVDSTNQDKASINLDDLLSLTGLTIKDLNWNFYLKQLPSLKLQYRVIDTLQKDGPTRISIRPVFKTYFPTVAADPITVNVKGITQAIVNEEQTRINDKKETFDLKVDKLKLEAKDKVVLTDKLAVEYGLDGLIDPRFTYTISHPEATSDQSMKMTIEVSKDGIKADKAPTPLDLDVRGIDNAIELMKEQKAFNEASSTLNISDIEYPAHVNKKLTQEDVVALGLSNKLNLLKYEYYLDNEKITTSGDHEMTITVKPLAKQNPILSPKPFTMKFTGISEAKEVAARQIEINALTGIAAQIDETQLLEANDEILTDALSKELNLGININDGFVYKITHQGINHDTKLKVSIQVSKVGITFEKPATEFEVDVKGINRAVAIAGQLKEQEEINKLASTEYDLKIDDTQMAANVNKELSNDKAFADLGITHHVKAGYVYLLNSDPVNEDGEVDFNIKVMVKDTVTGNVDKTIEARPVTPLKFNINGITASNNLKAEQEVFNGLKTKSVHATITFKDLINTDQSSSLPVTLEGYTGVLTQLMADRLNIPVVLKPEYVYTINYGDLTSDGKLSVDVEVSEPGVKNRANPTKATFDIDVVGIDKVQAILGLDKVQAVINKLAESEHTLTVNADSLAAANQEDINADLTAAINLKINTALNYRYLVTHSELNADGEIDCTVTIETKADPSDPTKVIEKPSINPVPIRVLVKGIEEFKLNKEQERVNALKASYEVKDADITNLDGTSNPIKFAGQSGPLTFDVIHEFGIKDASGKEFVMKPQYSYNYDFKDINKDGNADLTITVSGVSSFVPKSGTAENLVPTNVKAFALVIKGFTRADAEKELAQEQKRVNDLKGFTGGIIKEIQLPASSGNFDKNTQDKLFSIEKPGDKTQTIGDAKQIADLHLDTSKFIYSYSHGALSKDDTLELTLSVHMNLADGTPVKQVVTPAEINVPIVGINDATIQYINDIIIGGLSTKVVETTIDTTEVKEVLKSENKEPSDASLKDLSLSFTADSIKKLLASMTGVNDAAKKSILDSMGATDTLVGLSSWIEKQRATSTKTFNFHYELHKCDEKGNNVGGSLTDDGYLKFIIYFNIDGLAETHQEATIHVTGITDEKRRVELAAEQTRINNLGAQTIEIAETKLDQITADSNTLLTDDLIKEYGIVGKDGQPLEMKNGMVYHFSTDKSITSDDTIKFTITVEDESNPSLLVRDIDKNIVAATETEDVITGINGRRAVVTQTDAQNEINALAQGHYNMSKDDLQLDEIPESAPVRLKTAADFLAYGITFDPTASTTSKSLGTTFKRSDYIYIASITGLDADGTAKIKITATIGTGSNQITPSISTEEISIQVSGIDAAKALKAEQEKINDEGENGAGKFNVDADHFAVQPKVELTQDIVNGFGLPITLNSNYKYKYSLPTAITASGPMDMLIYVEGDGKQYGVAEKFQITVTGIDEYKELQKAIGDVTTAAANSLTTPIEVEVHALSLDVVNEEEMTQEIADKYGMGITLDTSKFAYKYSIKKGLTTDGAFEIELEVSNAGAIKSSHTSTITFHLDAKGIASANTVDADINSVADNLQVTQPHTGTVTKGYNTNEYTQGDVLTQDQLERLTKDTLSVDHADKTVFTPQAASGATRTYEVSSKTTTTLTITITDTDGDYSITRDVTLTGFVAGSSTNVLDYPTQVIRDDLSAIATLPDETPVTLPVSVHTTPEPLTQKWNDYLGLMIVPDSRFKYTFTNAKTDSGNMDVIVTAHMDGESDDSLDIVQKFVVDVKAPTAFDKVYMLNSFKHVKLDDSTTLHGLPFDVINYVDGITDQFRGYKASYKLGAIDPNTNAVEPLIVTLTSMDDASNVVVFKIHLIVGDVTKATGEAKALYDAGSVIDAATVVPKVTVQPTKDSLSVLSQVKTTLGGITSTDAVINAESFAQIAKDTPLTELILDKLNVDTHIGSAIGLLGEEFTVSTDKELTSNGDLTLTITPKDNSGDITITVHVTGIDEFAKVKKDLDELSQIYSVEPRLANIFTTNEYVPWTTKMDGDTLQRLTAHNEWTQAAIDELKTEVIRVPEVAADPKDQITRDITIKSKTDTKLVLEITDRLGDAWYSKEVTINGFVADAQPANNIKYLHELVQDELDAFKAAPPTLDNFEGNGITAVADSALTQDVIDYLKLPIVLHDGIKYTYTIPALLKDDGTFDITIKEAFPNNVITDTITMNVNFKAAPTLYAVAVADVSGLMGATVKQEDLPKELEEYIFGGLVNKENYKLENVVTTHTDKYIGDVEFDLVDFTTGASKHYNVGFIKQSRTVEADAATKAKHIYYKSGESITQTQANAILPTGEKLPALPSGMTYSITLENKTNSVNMNVVVRKGTTLLTAYEVIVNGFNTLDPSTAAISHTARHGDKFTSAVTKSDWILAHDMFGSSPTSTSSSYAAFRAGQTYAQVHDRINVMKNPGTANKYLVVIGDPTILGQSSDWVRMYFGNSPSGHDRFGVEHQQYEMFFVDNRHYVRMATQMTASQPGASLSGTGYSSLNHYRDRFSWMKTYQQSKDAGELMSSNPVSSTIAANSQVVVVRASGWNHDNRAGSKFTVYINAIRDLMEGKTPSQWGISSLSTTQKYSFLQSHSGTSDNGVATLSLLGGAVPSATTESDSHLTNTALQEFPKASTTETLTRLATNTKNDIKVEKPKADTSAAVVDQPLSDLMKTSLGLSPKPDETMTYSLAPIVNNGVLEATIKLTTGGITTEYKVKLNITGFDEYNAKFDSIKADLDGLKDSYAVKPRGGHVWTTSQYKEGDTFNPDTLHRLTAIDQWTEAASKETDADYLKDVDPTVTRTVVIDHITGTELALKVTDTVDGVSDDKIVTLTDFEDVASTADNDLDYSHEIMKKTLDAMASNPVTLSNFEGDGIAPIASAPLTQDILDYYGITFSLDPTATYTYSIIGSLKTDGDFDFEIKATYSSGDELTGTTKVSVVYKKPETSTVYVVDSIDPLKGSAVTESDIPDSLKDSILQDVTDKGNYEFENISLDESHLYGVLTFDLKNKTNDAARTYTVKVIQSDADITPTAAAKAKEIYYTPNKTITLAQANSLLPSSKQIPNPPSGFSYEIWLEKDGSDTKVHVTYKNGSDIESIYTLVVKGLTTIDPTTAQIATTKNHGTKFMSDISKSDWVLSRNILGNTASSTSASDTAFHAGLSYAQVSGFMTIMKNPGNSGQYTILIGDPVSYGTVSDWSIHYIGNSPTGRDRFNIQNQQYAMFYVYDHARVGMPTQLSATQGGSALPSTGASSMQWYKNRFNWMMSYEEASRGSEILSGRAVTSKEQSKSQILIVAPNGWTHNNRGARFTGYLDSIRALMNGDKLSDWSVNKLSATATVAYINSHPTMSHGSKSIVSFLGGSDVATAGTATAPAMLGNWYKTIPVTPAPAPATSSDEPVITVKAVPVSDQSDEPIEQEDSLIPVEYPIESQDGSFFAWTVQHIYKNN